MDEEIKRKFKLIITCLTTVEQKKNILDFDF